MPSVSMHFDHPPERTWEVLSEPRAYGFWVTGAHGVHESDPSWPAAGATFRHTQGVRPLLISDTTTVLRSEPPRRIELEARVRPLLVARVIVTIEPEGDGSRVVMEEHATGRPARAPDAAARRGGAHPRPQHRVAAPPARAGRRLTPTFDPGQVCRRTRPPENSLHPGKVRIVTIPAPEAVPTAPVRSTPRKSGTQDRARRQREDQRLMRKVQTGDEQHARS